MSQSFRYGITPLTGQIRKGVIYIIFDTLYAQYYKFIHFLLHQHQISYNYDEYFQLLSIRLWELSMKYDATFNQSFKTYINYQLKYYLIDLLRSAHTPLTTTPLDASANELKAMSSSHLYLLLEDIVRTLKPAHRTWFRFYLQGYQQKEIQQLMQVSATTVRKYKIATFRHIKQALTQDDLKKGF
ncbi:sigma-70 family RNA polymerase sigma factor [Staphylococcus delphini]|uniref:sigma-70 family RNA polymerase sigma factor n=1 Tax=Staphylococcus delphini TaxID=53344 RepID=UPI0023B21327|nr:sigma-70 family RNA polymerase sigma factor [Staphylococcus delphini]MDE9752247.1 sigma-70 family RNA polymerase sigma factor [Staphylococcus delphini]MDE9790290.1 sigma-70 family RNA polymerase sigma factor [Staphylococcus delphini]MDE9791885.1 sigma-70 family RNA polymerase sigma factor [Staphylococcus delphini]MDE9795124.1 sigma-70 family RNA polymerase sigma factor [Staphylococcus delphini]MDE9796346.1 sigma-70 family RNA polymerase sigma factor [Staphylococcus delphini]